MQSDFFGLPPAEQRPALPALTLSDDATTDGYSQRTIKNAHSADLTIALATDFTTAGERLTKRAAGNKYLAIDFERSAPEQVEEQAQAIVKRLEVAAGSRLNVAGNGIYTLAQHGISQEQVNQRLYTLLRRVHELHPLTSVRSGGQTGVDIAGLIAAVALNIPAIGFFPKGYVQRNVNKQDRPQDPERIRAAIFDRAQKLLSATCPRLK